MKKILQTLILPKEITPFEADYLKKTNRIALVFFALHLPVFVFIAWANRTGAVAVGALTTLVLAGPTVAYFRVKNPRVVSVIYGITAMAMGGLLVHVGQGPVQIEMHFYFFALIAMLALFGNPLVVVAAAVTVALHHLALWFVVPRSVFNYDAPVWVVGVHAAFVVLESVATCYIARSFFDNVIGLEKIVRARTEQLEAAEQAQRRVLDNVDQGFVTLGRDATIAPGRSAAFDAWFGVPEAGATLFDVFQGVAPAFAESARQAWEQVVDGFLPLDLSLDQMPRALEFGGRCFDLRFKPIGNAEAPERFLVIVADVTEAKAHERAEMERREAMHLLERLLSDRNVLLEYFDEANAIITRITSGVEADDLQLLKRSIHTLKGNSAVFGIDSVAMICHELESWIEQEGSAPPRPALQRLHERWARLSDDTEHMIGKNKRVIQLEEVDHLALQNAVQRRTPHDSLLRMIHELKLERVQTRLDLFVGQAERVARRLGKSVIVTADGHGLRVDATHWAGFWGAFVHAIRNAVDHGIESAEARQEAGKGGDGHIRISASTAAGAFIVSIADDGPGINWALVAEKATARGLSTATYDDVVSALFADGVSTAEAVTDVSGRGVGMGALRAATEALHGHVEVESNAHGTMLRFVFPTSELAPERPHMPAPSHSPAAA